VCFALRTRVVGGLDKQPFQSGLGAARWHTGMKGPKGAWAPGLGYAAGPGSKSAPCRNTALHDATENGHTECVKVLLEKGADVNAESIKKCAFPCGLELDGRRLHAPARLCAVRLVG
jgi:hypothetical protein